MYAVITGASSGIGEQLAKRLAKEGYDLILVARRRERLTALSDKLTATHKELECDIFTADLMQLAAAGGQTLIAVFRDDIVFFFSNAFVKDFDHIECFAVQSFAVDGRCAAFGHHIHFEIRQIR